MRYNKRKTNSNINVMYLILFFLLVSATFYFQMVSSANAPNHNTVTQGAEEGYLSHQEFIDRIGEAQIKYQSQYEFRPSILIAQAALESNYGRSELSSDYYNLFGRKAYGNEPAVEFETQEFRDGDYVTIVDRFKVYQSWSASMEDYLRLLNNGVDWDPNLYQGVLRASSYQDAAKELQKAGYATDPYYADKIIDIIELFGLNKYDK